MTLPTIRSRAGLAAVAAITIAASGAGAATIHRFAVTQGTGTGSLGATAFTQTNSSSSALQGEVNASPNTGLRVPFGVLGEYDAPGKTFGAGVLGLSTTGYGVGAETASANDALIAINTSNGSAIEASANTLSSLKSTFLAENMGSGPAVSGTSQSNLGVVGTTINGSAGVSGVDGGTQGAYGVLGTTTEGFGVYGDAAKMTGVFASGSSGASNVPVLQAFSDTSGTELFDAHVYGSDNLGYTTASITFPSYGASSTIMNSVGASSDFQLNGDVYLTGAVFSGCTSFPNPLPSQCNHVAGQSIARTSSGAYVREYGGAHTSSTIEDAGEAQLTNGFAHVTLDRTFASTISTRKPYLVFTTPQGDGPGLFVARRTATGFDVRQSLGGRSNMSFDYRILAQPFDATSDRMAVIELRGSQRQTPDSSTTAARLHRALKIARANRPIAHVRARSLVSGR